MIIKYRIIGLMTIAACCEQPATAQTEAATDTLAARVTRFGRGLPQEKVYLHIDNTCYFVGDTIWYKGYVTRTDRGTLTDLSRILYVELLTPDGYLVERQQLQMNDGTAHGAFTLTDSLYAGYYELRAYTRWMLNFGKHEHPHSPYTEDMFYSKQMAKDFFRDYDKLYSRVFPVFNKPKENGRYPKDMTLRPMRRYLKTPKDKPGIDLRFYPEGGHLVAGVTNRIAFELNDADGKHLQAMLSVQDKNGQEVAKSTTTNRGRGMFTLTATKTDAPYKAVLNIDGHDYEVPLPEAEEQGYALWVTQDDSLLHIGLLGNCQETAELGLQIQYGGVSKLFLKVPPSVRDTTLHVPLKRLSTGVNQITLFNGEGHIYADRLVFVNRHDYDQPQITVSGIRNSYAPFDSICLKLQLAHPADTVASVSLAVRDHATDEPTYDNGTMLTEMLLASELKGFVEDPDYYFEADDSLHRAALDLLMMVQGWRRYDWRMMAGVEDFYFDFLPEKRQILAGSVHRTYPLLPESNFGDKVYLDVTGDSTELYTTAANSTFNARRRIYTLQDLYGPYIREMKKDVRVKASFVKGKNVVDASQATQGGQFYMPSPAIYGDYTLFLSATDTTKSEKQQERKRQKGFMDEGAYPEFYVKLDHFFPVFPHPYSFYQDAAFENRFAEWSEQADSLSFTRRTLPSVTVRNRRGGLRKLGLSQPALVVDAYEAFNLTADHGLNGGMHDWRTFSRQVVMACFGDMGMERHYYVEERWDGKLLELKEGKKMQSLGIADVSFANQSSAQFSMSNQTLRKYHRLRHLDKLYIYTDYVPREQGSWKYKGDNQPDVVIDYRLLPDNTVRPTYRDRRYVMQGYAVCTDFYSPDYSRRPLPDTKDHRRTLLWMPDVKFNKQGEARVRLFNNSKETVIAIEAEGITPAGKPVVWKTGSGQTAQEKHTPDDTQTTPTESRQK